MELQYTKVNEQAKKSLVQQFYRHCDFKPKYYDFPGGMPVSLSRKDMNHLKNYSVCEKTDGARYMLFICNDGMYFIDRMMNFYKIDPLFCIIPSELKSGTVLDGELVQSFDLKWMYMVFDVFSVAGKLVKDVVQHYRRLNEFSQYLRFMKPLRARNTNENNEVGIYMKRFYHVYNLAECANCQYPYKIDGFIYTPSYRKIYNGTDKRTYKWKAPIEHTIDFELQKNENGVYAMYLWDKGSKIAIQEILNMDSVKDGIQKYENQNIQHPMIVECQKSNDPQSDIHIWDVLKFRFDKHRPNSMRTYFSTMEVIKENITLQDLHNIN